MIRYYKDSDKKAIDSSLVDEQAFEVAEKFASTSSVNKTQLRKFYGDVKNLEQIWNNQQKSYVAFKVILPQIKMLKAKVAYARSRELVKDSFVLWINDNVKQIDEPNDFRAFLLHFEAVVGFCYGKLED